MMIIFIMMRTERKSGEWSEDYKEVEVVVGEVTRNDDRHLLLIGSGRVGKGAPRFSHSPVLDILFVYSSSPVASRENRTDVLDISGNFSGGTAPEWRHAVGVELAEESVA